MNIIENFLLNSNFSWTTSKLIPYLLTLMLGIILAVVLRKKMGELNVFVKWSIRSLLVLLPFIIYFSFNLIYEGDFTNNSKEVIRTSLYKELIGKKLVVLTIPNCPYCFEAISKMKILKKRVPKIEIEYVLCSSDSINNPAYLEWYSSEAGEAVTVRLAEDVGAMAELADYVFPTFVLVENKKLLRKWSNDSFGVVALDEVEKRFK